MSLRRPSASHLNLALSLFGDRDDLISNAELCLHDSRILVQKAVLNQEFLSPGELMLSSAPPSFHSIQGCLSSGYLIKLLFRPHIKLK
jgi:hypothetical protein